MTTGTERSGRRGMRPAYSPGSRRPECGRLCGPCRRTERVHVTSWHEQASVRHAQRRTVRVLSAAQILGGVGIGVAGSLGALLAEDVTDSETLAGIARTASTLGAAAVGLPLALLAMRRGRRRALGLGWAL